MCTVVCSSILSVRGAWCVVRGEGVDDACLAVSFGRLSALGVLYAQ